jgi:hypothetical protein
LQREDREVVQQTRQPRFARKDELTSEEHRFWKARDNLLREIVGSFNDIMAQRGNGLGVIALGLHIADIARGFPRDVALKIFHLLRAFEVACIHDADLHKDEVAEQGRKKARHGKDCVNPEAIESVDEQNRGSGVRFARGENVWFWRLSGDRWKERVQAFQFAHGFAIMAMRQHREHGERRGDNQSDPAAVGEFRGGEHHENERREQEADGVDGQFLFPVRS